MINFFSDIDNTLIYSHRKAEQAIFGDLLIAEYLNGYAQSYMTKKTFDFLAAAKDLFFVPTTTRTPEQYARLSDFFSNFGCRYALVCNGGILLDNNRVDPAWTDETLALAMPELSSFYEAERLIHFMYPNKEMHKVEKMLLYFKSEYPEVIADELSAILNTTELNIFSDSRKVYCTPASINKGNALKRFSSKFGLSRVIAAGDSVQDVPMLKSADIPILTEAIAEKVCNPDKIVCSEKAVFSDFICDFLTSTMTGG